MVEAHYQLPTIRYLPLPVPVLYQGLPLLGNTLTLEAYYQQYSIEIPTITSTYTIPSTTPYREVGHYRVLLEGRVV